MTGVHHLNLITKDNFAKEVLDNKLTLFKQGEQKYFISLYK